MFLLKHILVFSLFVLTKTEDLKDLSFPALLKLANDVTQVRFDDVTPADVSYYISNRHQFPNPTKINTNNAKQVEPNKKTKFIIHGYIEHHRKSWIEELRKELLMVDDVNVIVVDWERVARSEYVSSAKNVKLVGNILGNFVIDYNFSLSNVHFIGHSLGAHLGGFAAKKITEKSGEKVHRITALDPAGPAFIQTLDNERLSKNDAIIVDAWHTDGGVYGYFLPIGTFDLYFNGGVRWQPGCMDGIAQDLNIGKGIEENFCSHARSITYFIEALNTGKIICKKCPEILDVRNKNCLLGKEFTIIEHANVTEEITGICDIDTNQEVPFLPNGESTLK